MSTFSPANPTIGLPHRDQWITPSDCPTTRGSSASRHIHSKIECTARYPENPTPIKSPTHHNQRERQRGEHPRVIAERLARVLDVRLGLAVLLRVEQQHDAEVSVADAHPRTGASTPGALFTVRFPVRPAP